MTLQVGTFQFRYLSPQDENEIQKTLLLVSRSLGPKLGVGFRAGPCRIWGIGTSYYNVPKAIFYLLNGDYKP